MSTAEKFEHYEVLKREDGSLFELGRGAMGITYKALDTDLQCLVALKIINPSTIANEDSEQRFFREARSAAQLRHPNIASVFRLGKTQEGTHYYAMEFCEGQTLQQLIDQSGPIECHRALEFTLQVTKALIVAEERHLVHRDLKPSNLIVTQRSDEGEVIKVIDFGLAKTTAAEGTMWSSMGTHGFIGTAHFASPEQIEDKPVDTRSDIYSLGSTLWFMLRGKPPFEGSLARIMSQHLTAEPNYSILKDVPERVVAMMRRMMQKEAADRPQSALELRREIKDCLESLEHPEEANEAFVAPEKIPIAEPPSIQDNAPPAPALPDEGAQSGEPGEPALPGEPVQLGEPALPDPPAQTDEPSRSEEPADPDEVWTPSLLDLLRVRSVLAPVEALRIGEGLAAQLDEHLENGIPDAALRIQDVTIHFRDTESTSEIQARLRQHVTDWPAFDLIIGARDSPPQQETPDPSQMVTFVPGADSIGDKAQQLAHLLYELLGGVAGARYVPLASLGETGNDLLRRATVVGLAGYPVLRDLIEQLRSTTEGSPPPPPIPIPFRSATPPPARATQVRHATTAPVQLGTPPATSATTPPALPAPVESATPAPVRPSTPPPIPPTPPAPIQPEVSAAIPPKLPPPIPPAFPAPNPPSTPPIPMPAAPGGKSEAKQPSPSPAQSARPAAKARKSSPIERTIVTVSTVIGLIILAAALLPLFRGHPVPAISSNASTPSLFPTATPPQNTEFTSSPLISNPTNPLTGASPMSNGRFPLTSNAGITLSGPVQFTIFDDLGEGQLTETVSVYVDDQTTPAGTLSVDKEKPHASVIVNLPSSGRHFFSAQTQSVVTDHKKGVKKIVASGRWEADFRGGERYNLSATPTGNGDSYTLELSARN